VALALFAFSHHWALDPLSLGYRLGVIGAAFLLALLSWRYVETPFRTRRVCPSARSMLTLAGGAW